MMDFYTDGLLSKWGFGDGDILEDLLWDTDLCDVDQHDILIEVAVKYIVPKLDQNIELQTMETIHNPVRAYTVDGRKVDHYNDEDIALTPDVVHVPDNVIIAIAKSIK